MQRRILFLVLASFSHLGFSRGGFNHLVAKTPQPRITVINNIVTIQSDFLFVYIMCELKSSHFRVLRPGDSL